MRLQRRGRTKAPFYHIVVADSRAPRDGRFIEKLGTYNPMTKPATIELNRDKALDWLMKGAQPTDTVRAILGFKGVLYRKHLLRGVGKGALTQEQADAKYQEWVDTKEARIAARFKKTADEKAAVNAKLTGLDMPVKPKAIPAVEVKQAPVETPAPAVEEAAAETPEVVEAAVETPEVVETAAPEVVEEAPVVQEAVPAAVEATVAADDLTKIEGIGPKINELLQNAGIRTFGDLAAAAPDAVKEILTAAGGNFSSHDPGTWPQQAQLAADGNWDALKTLQDELQGGRVVEAEDAAPAE